MHLKKIVVVVLVVVVNLLSAQSGKVKFQYGTPYLLPKKHQNLGFRGTEKEGLIQLELQNMHKDLIILPVDTLDYSTKAPIMVDKKTVGNADFKSLIHLQNNYYMTFYTWNKGRKEIGLDLYPFDMHSGQFLSERKKLLDGGKRKTYYGVMTSANGSMLLLTHEDYDPMHKLVDKFSFGFKVFDYNFNSLRSKDMTSPYSGEKIDVVQWHIDSDGAVYALMRIDEDIADSSQVDKKADNPSMKFYRYELLIFSTDNNEPKTVNLMLDKKYAQRHGFPEIIDDNNGSLIFVGYYTDKLDKQNRGVDGLFALKINKKMGTLSNYGDGYFEFPDDLVKQSESERARKEMDEEYKNGNGIQEYGLKFCESRFNKDGSIVVVGEEHYTAFSMVPGSSAQGAPMTITTSLYEDIFALRINADGALAWMKKIPKRQQCDMGTGSMSFHYLSIDDKDCFLFMDNEENIHLTSDQVPTNYIDKKGGFLVCVRIDKNGNMEKENLLNVRSMDVVVQPSLFKTVGDSKIIGCALFKTFINSTPMSRGIVEKRKAGILTIDFK